MKTYILHHNRYWTEYVDFLLKDKEHFSLVNSSVAVEPYVENGSIIPLEVFDPQKHKIILTPGRLHEPTANNKIIMRFMHSPGFFVYPMIRAYAELLKMHSGSDYAFLMLDQYYHAMVLRDIKDPAVDHFKYAMMTDPKVYRLKVDPMMLKIKEAPKHVKREKGSGLLCLTWLLIDNDFSRFIEIAKTLRKEIKLNILLHPLMRMDPKYLQEIQSLEGSLFETVYYNLSRSELIHVYDKHEFVISDGSGSCYEAMLRGCHPVAVHGMRNTTGDETFNEVLEEEYLPFPSYSEISRYPGFDSDAFLKRYAPYLHEYDYNDAIKVAREEIMSLPILDQS